MLRFSLEYWEEIGCCVDAKPFVERWLKDHPRRRTATLEEARDFLEGCIDKSKFSNYMDWIVYCAIDAPRKYTEREWKELLEWVKKYGDEDTWQLYRIISRGRKN